MKRLDAAAWSQNSGRWGWNKLRESPILLEVYLHGNSIFRGCPQHGHNALWLPLFPEREPGTPRRQRVEAKTRCQRGGDVLISRVVAPLAAIAFSAI
jgi:hypothetical protein